MQAKDWIICTQAAVIYLTKSKLKQYNKEVQKRHFKYNTWVKGVLRLCNLITRCVTQ